MRAVLDPNVLIAALLSPSRAPAQIVSRWFAGEFELVISEALLAELDRALAYPKLRARISGDDADAFVELLRHGAVTAPDLDAPRRSRDPGDDYLVALAESVQAILVSGDQHLLELGEKLPVKSARAFLDGLEQGPS